MPFKAPFAQVDHRSTWLRATLLSASFLGLLASMPLWLNSHSFPLLPIGSWFPVLPSPWDKCLYALMLVALVAAVWFYRPAVSLFIIAGLFAFFEDQNRGQPWFYMYWVMLLLSLLPDSTVIAACRVAISVVYIWSGIQKFNSRFFEVMPAWFVAPAARWHFPAGLIEVLRWLIASAPVVELGIGLALWVPALRRGAIGAAVMLHLAALLFLGPLGYNYNWVVWPWNLAMIALLLSLFGIRASSAVKIQATRDGIGLSGSQRISTKARERVAPPSTSMLKQTFCELRRSRRAMVVLGLYSFLPILSYAGLWDSYFSFSLYAENSAVANIFISKDFGERLPPKLRAYVQRFPQTYDPEHQGPYLFVFQVWGFDDLRVPPISEVRNFRSVFRFLRSYSKEPSDLRMIVGQRSGPVIFYQGTGHEFLIPK